MSNEIVKTDLLIVGAGPAGAALACFLASYGWCLYSTSSQDTFADIALCPGLTGIMISAALGTADTPRAHVTNMAALECLRDIDLEKQCIEAGASGDHMIHTRWCHSMAGEEYARLYSFGNDPKRKVGGP